MIFNINSTRGHTGSLLVQYNINNEDFDTSSSDVVSETHSSDDIAVTESFVISLYSVVPIQGHNAQALPMFHALTGYDAASSFA